MGEALALDAAWLFAAFLLLLVLVAAGIAARRFLLERAGATVECGLRKDRGTWRLGVASYRMDEFCWFGVFGISMRPEETFPRRDLAVVSRRLPTDVEVSILGPDRIVIECQLGDRHPAGPPGGPDTLAPTGPETPFVPSIRAAPEAPSTPSGTAAPEAPPGPSSTTGPSATAGPSSTTGPSATTGPSSTAGPSGTAGSDAPPSELAAPADPSGASDPFGPPGSADGPGSPVPGRTVELALAESALTGLLAWLEAAPPGSHFGLAL